MDSDMLVILASLLCAVICVLVLAIIARCAWLRRSSPSPSLQNHRSVMNKGIRKKVLESLPKLSFDTKSVAGGDVKLEDCSICQSEFADGELIRVLPRCGHGFHVDCIDTWLGARSSCPSCRQLLAVPTAATCHKCGADTEMVDGGSNNSFLP